MLSGSLYKVGISALLGIFLIGGLNVSCKENEQMPEKLTYKFSYGPKLQKIGDSLTVSYKPHSTNTQRPQPEDSPLQQKTVTLSTNEFKSVWKKIKKIDVPRYSNVPDEDFVPTPPDVNYTERLRLVIDDEVIIDWSHEFGRLNDKLVKPLNEVNEVLMELFNKRLDED
ncbi:MAG: hypothetical protein V3V99_11315 [candidate division Zixibacteria bacterium]